MPGGQKYDKRKICPEGRNTIKGRYAWRAEYKYKGIVPKGQKYDKRKMCPKGRNTEKGNHAIIDSTVVKVCNT